MPDTTPIKPQPDEACVLDRPVGRLEPERCDCRACLRERNEGATVAGVWMPAEVLRMVVCAQCGNKRCPHATDHRNACTGSNDTGQIGSAYGRDLCAACVTPTVCTRDQRCLTASA